MRVIRRIMSQVTLSGGIDTVVAWSQLPDGAKLNSIHLDSQAVGATVAANVIVGVPLGYAGFVVPVPEPDTPLDINTLWDNVIPKDAALAVGSEDLDTETADATSEWEIGEVEPGAIIDGGTTPTEIFRRQEFITAARARIALADGTTSLWVPTSEFKTRINRSVRVSVPSMVLIAATQPAGDQTTATVDLTPNAGEWSTVRFVEEALRNAFIHLLNFVEAGAESPYDTIAAIIADFIEPTILEVTAGAISTAAWTIFTKATFDITVPGDFSKQVLSSQG